MTQDEYVIVNKSVLLKRIEELETKMRSINRLIDRPHATTIKCQIDELKQILSQSTPLIPEIEKAFDAGRKLSNRSQLYTPDFYWTKENYISNLKLDIQ